MEIVTDECPPGDKGIQIKGKDKAIVDVKDMVDVEAQESECELQYPSMR